MKKIAFHIQKGGVGKTTLSGNVASYLSKTKKVVLVDCDIQQGSSSTWFLNHEILRLDIKDTFLKRIDIDQALKQIQKNFYILPCVPSGTFRRDVQHKLQDFPYLIDDFCVELEKLGFEFAIFDLSPSFELWERRIILAMCEVVTPLTPEFLSLEGINIFKEEFDSLLKSYRKKVKHEKIICNMLNRSFKRHNLHLKQFKTFGYDLYEIGQDAKIAESQLYKKSVFDYYPESKSILELSRLGEALCL
ncbi:Cellulose biosynthesis protein BcsQ [Borreliella japonica]|uniref:Cellulose biosynthesis protein BcsQ n=1 Tax=Borreliella japonica TaxID=34095 RepID=A0A1G4QM19_BORJA|nr:ParA family protein [Borreliella japonica]WKC88562.1 ParA family protein [Borreliella japonica]SCW45572.1 Cellulose biosynthesis protein BcsQ [Borreliella japonica]